MSIEQFSLDYGNNELAITFADAFSQQLSFEFLRVYSPLAQMAGKGKPAPVVAHQKMVRLLAVEPVAKHGFRLVFDDEHQAIYSSTLLQELAHNKNRLWQEYLTKLAESGQNREAMIAFKSV